MTRTPAFLAAGLVLALAVLVPVAAQAKDGTVVVSAAGASSSSVTVRLTTLGAPEINNQEYRLASGRKTISGYSISQVLRAAQTEAESWLDLETLPGVEVDRPSGGPVILSREEALSQTDSPPVFYENGGTTVFVMPGSPGREYVFRFTPVGIRVRSEAPFEVSLTSSPKRPRKGQAVRIVAAVEGVRAGSVLSYRWSFSDGGVKTTTSPSVLHRFEGQGRRSVVVTVTAGENEAQAFLEIDVVDGGGGGADPPTGGGGDQGSGRGSGGGYGTSGTGGGGPYTSGDGAGSGGGTPKGKGSPTPLPADRARESGGQSNDGFKEVSGLLIDPATSAAQSAVPEVAPKGTDAGGPGGLGLSGEAATLFGVGLLIALGGLIEARVLVRRP